MVDQTDSFGVYDASVRWIAAVSLSRSRTYLGVVEVLEKVYVVIAES